MGLGVSEPAEDTRGPRAARSPRSSPVCAGRPFAATAPSHLALDSRGPGPGAGIEGQENVDTAGVRHRGEAAEEVAVESVVGDGPARALHPRNQRSGVPPVLPAYEVHLFLLLHGPQAVPDVWVGERAVHPAALIYDPVLPVVTALAVRERPGLQQHVVIQRVPLDPRDMLAPDVLLEDVTGYAEMVGGTISTLTAAASDVLVEVRVSRRAGEGETVQGSQNVSGGGAGESGSSAGTEASIRGASPRDDRRPASGPMVEQSRTRSTAQQEPLLQISA